MTSQDTFYRLKDDIYVGMNLQHKFRDNMLSPEYNWFCTINEIDAENNNLKVTITSTAGYSHPEDWDMAITVGGLADGEYINIDGEDC